MVMAMVMDWKMLGVVVVEGNKKRKIKIREGFRLKEYL